MTVVCEADLLASSPAMFARQCGGHGLKVTTVEGLGCALAAVRAKAEPALEEVVTDA